MLTNTCGTAEELLQVFECVKDQVIRIYEETCRVELAESISREASLILYRPKHVKLVSPGVTLSTNLHTKNQVTSVLLGGEIRYFIEDAQIWVASLAHRKGIVRTVPLLGLSWRGYQRKDEVLALSYTGIICMERLPVSTYRFTEEISIPFEIPL